MTQPPGERRTFIADALAELYQESPSLITGPGTMPRRPRQPRSTERAIAGRLLIYTNPQVVPYFGEAAVIDFEYERVGVGRLAKRRAEHKISPDLIVHEGGAPTGNFLAIEVKCAGHGRRRAWTWTAPPRPPTLEDYRKLHFLSHHLEDVYPPEMEFYR